MIFYIYSYVYLCIYTPSYQHFKAFAVSKFDSETTFQQEFKVPSLKAIQHVSLGIHVYTRLGTTSSRVRKAPTSGPDRRNFNNAVGRHSQTFLEE